MKVTNTKVLPDGRRRLTVEVGADEDLVGVYAEGFYRLGGSDGDVVPGHVLHDTALVTWCWYQQKWI